MICAACRERPRRGYAKTMRSSTPINLEATLVALLRLAGERGTQIERLQTHAPTLEDVFLKLTGRGLRD